jgi:hypothetical protein
MDHSENAVACSDETSLGYYFLRESVADETYNFTNVRVRKETAKAFLCEIGGGEFWVPKSQIIKVMGAAP